MPSFESLTFFDFRLYISTSIPLCQEIGDKIFQKIFKYKKSLYLGFSSFTNVIFNQKINGIYCQINELFTK